MSRYIDADKLCEGLKHMAKYQEPYKQSTILGVVSTIENTSSADVVEVRHGAWAFEVKHFFDDYGDLNVYARGYCSECKKDYPFNATIASAHIERPDNLVGYEHWDIDVEPIKAQVSNEARTNKNLYPFCPYCGAKMDGKERGK